MAEQRFDFWALFLITYIDKGFKEAVGVLIAVVVAILVVGGLLTLVNPVFGIIATILMFIFGFWNIVFQVVVGGTFLGVLTVIILKVTESQ